MYIARVKFWFLAFLLFSYLAGILILSIISFNEGKVRSLASLNTKIENAYIHQQVKKGKNYEFGLQGVRPLLSRSKIQWCGDLKFLEPPGKVVALASFPGSGNTWLRYLLQQATGIFTGSIYKDYGLLKNGFPAEFITNGSVLVVKTHEWGQLARNKFDKAILLVRSPGAAIQAEFNRQSGGHIGFASPDRYKRTKGKYWSHFVSDKLRGWELTNLDWLYNFTGPTHVIFYEQLVENTEHTLKSIINFTGLPIDFERLKCALSRKEGIYRRKKRPMKFDPFNVEMKERIKQVQDKVYEAIYNFATPERRKKR